MGDEELRRGGRAGGRAGADGPAEERLVDPLLQKKVLLFLTCQVTCSPRRPTNKIESFCIHRSDASTKIDCQRRGQENRFVARTNRGYFALTIVRANRFMQNHGSVTCFGAPPRTELFVTFECML